ncbi:MAG: alpha-2-macroglobulin family protein [Dehalococcoidia bacterium]
MRSGFTAFCLLAAGLATMAACNYDSEVSQPLRLELSIPGSATLDDELTASFTVTNTTEEQINYVTTLATLYAVDVANGAENEWPLNLFGGSYSVWPVMLAGGQAHTHEQTWDLSIGAPTDKLSPGEYELVTSVIARLPGDDESSHIESNSVKLMVR